MNTVIRYLSALLIVFIFSNANAQESNVQLKKEIESLKNHSVNLDHKLDVILKKVDDLLWFKRVGDVAHVDKLYIYGSPNANKPNPTAMGVNNPLKFWTYVFIPKNIDLSKKYPLIVLPHGGVHANLTTY
jgi:hypothetical protein